MIEGGASSSPTYLLASQLMNLIHLLGPLVSQSANMEMDSRRTGGNSHTVSVFHTVHRIWGPWHSGGQAGLLGVSNETPEICRTSVGLGPGLASQRSRECGGRRLRLGHTVWGQLVPQAAPHLFPFEPGLNQSILYTVTRTGCPGYLRPAFKSSPNSPRLN